LGLDEGYVLEFGLRSGLDGLDMEVDLRYVGLDLGIVLDLGLDFNFLVLTWDFSFLTWDLTQDLLFLIYDYTWDLLVLTGNTFGMFWP